MEGLSQCQTNTTIGLTFSIGLRAALRQDPDIIMIGEVRDEETTEVGMHRYLLGHLVLSTIHTNSAAETITRFENMGIPKYVIASALKSDSSTSCEKNLFGLQKQIKMDKTTLQDIQDTIGGIHPSQSIPEELLLNVKIYKGSGCEKCNNTGYKGRIGIFEILMLKDEVVSNILAGENARIIHKTTLKMEWLHSNKMQCLKALQGITTMDEVYRVANQD